MISPHETREDVPVPSLVLMMVYGFLHGESNIQSFSGSWSTMGPRAPPLSMMPGNRCLCVPTQHPVERNECLCFFTQRPDERKADVCGELSSQFFQSVELAAIC